jgi:hypothetical protein
VKLGTELGKLSRSIYELQMHLSTSDHFFNLLQNLTVVFNGQLETIILLEKKMLPSHYIVFMKFEIECYEMV